jgi:hypothetical protein
MACLGFHCNAHNLGTTTCVGHRAACATNNVLSMSSEFTSGRVTAYDIDLLRSSIRAEVTTYDAHASYGPYTQYQDTEYNAATVILPSQHNDLEAMAAYFAGPATNVMSAQTIAATDWWDLKNKYDSLRQNCICNADCSCNAVCACHNDCGCNYSDYRLKKDIVYC